MKNNWNKQKEYYEHDCTKCYFDERQYTYFRRGLEEKRKRTVYVLCSKHQKEYYAKKRFLRSI
jgi:hypothetical protein